MGSGVDSPGAATPSWVGRPGKAEAGGGDGEGGGKCLLPLGLSAGALSWGLSAWAVVLPGSLHVEQGGSGRLPPFPRRPLSILRSEWGKVHELLMQGNVV